MCDDIYTRTEDVYRGATFFSWVRPDTHTHSHDMAAEIYHDAIDRHTVNIISSSGRIGRRRRSNKRATCTMMCMLLRTCLFVCVCMCVMCARASGKVFVCIVMLIPVCARARVYAAIRIYYIIRTGQPIAHARDLATHISMLPNISIAHMAFY